MKVAIIGTGAVGAAAAMSITVADYARELVLVNRSQAKAKGIATDLHYGAPLWSSVNVTYGDYEALVDSTLMILSAGVNEKAGGATDRNDPAGRLRLLEANAKVFEEIVPRMVKVAPLTPILVLTDPPDPLVDICRHFAGHNRVFATSTYLDSLRFRVHLAKYLNVSVNSVNANVIGEHGTSSVFLWSSAQVGGVPIADVLSQRRIDFAELRSKLEKDVREANISIIEGIGASQYGIGMVAARVTRCVLGDERAVLPVSTFNPIYGVAISLPSVVGAEGADEVVWPAMSKDENQALDRSAEAIRKSLTKYIKPS